MVVFKDKQKEKVIDFKKCTQEKVVTELQVTSLLSLQNLLSFLPPALTRISWVVFTHSICEGMGSRCGQPCLGVAVAGAAWGDMELSGPGSSLRHRAVLCLWAGAMGLPLPADRPGVS